LVRAASSATQLFRNEQYRSSTEADNARVDPFGRDR